MSTVLTRDEIQAAKDISIEFVKAPLWSPGDPEKGLFIRGLTGTDRDSFEMAMIDMRKGPTGKRTQEINLQNLRAKLIVRCAVDSDDPETAKLVFQPQDVEWLGRKSAQALQPLYEKAQELSGLSNEDVDELTAELGNAPSDASGSGSLLPSGIEASPNANAGSAPTSLPNGWPTTESSPSGTGDSTS